MRIDRIALVFCGYGLFAALFGCAGSLDDKESFLDGGTGSGGATGACSDVPAQIFSVKCGGAGCHGPSAPQQGLNLESPGVASRVVGVTAKECMGMLADPQNPGGSLIYTKLLSGVTCGAQMPLARPSLAPAEIDCVKAWIQAQAPSGATSSSGSGK
jgi:hypothetical protein